MSQKGNYPAPPKYLNDFSKALASEVRILLAEVGKLRDERRQLQYEIAELMAVKSKFGGGGEYNSEWMPKHEEPPAPASPAPPTAPSVIDDGAPARPAWRTVHRREERRAKAKAKALPAPAPAPPAIAAAPEPSNLPAWAQWKPNPLLSPAPIMGTSSSPLPADVPMPRSGLFGASAYTVLDPSAHLTFSACSQQALRRRHPSELSTRGNIYIGLSLRSITQFPRLESCSPREGYVYP
ncbi:hypothetical protein BD311DRAFT_667941 [Dichomitus squalens]|uniref:Uncharacterized protein n=1 Tax=Dichomitus squalens TaxID=114155 RepID=A0A4Q9MHZ6_9APHY|nr:hypothetical protein BD311DRAFT_667941 [Dichomitus squalens]